MNNRIFVVQGVGTYIGTIQQELIYEKYDYSQSVFGSDCDSFKGALAARFISPLTNFS